MGNLCNKNKTHNNLEEIIDQLDIEKIEKNIIKLRYINELDELKSGSKSSTGIYNISNFFLTTLSIILPGIMSIQKINTKYENILFWSSWGMSVGITLLNGYIKLFKIDRNYYFYNYNYEKYVSEGWNYIELGGVYNSKDTHSAAYKRFMGNVERLKTDNLNTLYSDVKSSDNIKKKKKKQLDTKYMSINTDINIRDNLNDKKENEKDNVVDIENNINDVE